MVVTLPRLTHYGSDITTANIMVVNITTANIMVVTLPRLTHYGSNITTANIMVVTLPRLTLW